MLRNNSKQSGESWRRKRKGCGGKDLQERKVLSLEWKSEWVMEYQVIVSIWLLADKDRIRFYS